MTSDESDEFASLMRTADPALTPADSPLLPRHLAIRDRIIAGGSRVTRSRAMWAPTVLLASTPLAAVFIVVLIVLTVSPVAVTPVFALTPAPLRYSHVDASAAAVLRQASSRLSASPVVNQPMRGAHSVGWYLNLTIAPASQTATIVPEETLTKWGEDLRGTVTVRAGWAYAAGPNSSALPSADSPAPGTVLDERTLGPRDLPDQLAAGPGSGDEAMRSFLSQLDQSASSEAGGIIHALTNAFIWWTFSDEQQASALRLLAETDDLEVLGSTIDRAGREVMGLRAAYSPNPHFEVTVLISVDTGRILGVEETTRVPLADGVPEGAVTAYTLWETGEE